MFNQVTVLAILGLGASTFVAGQGDTSGQVDPTATCPYQVVDQIQQCRSAVYSDEALLPGGPCASTDWACICNVQQGLLACYAPCPGSTPATDIAFNDNNCNGQNGVYNAAASSGGPEYSGSPITTVVSGDLTATTGAAEASTQVLSSSSASIQSSVASTSLSAASSSSVQSSISSTSEPSTSPSATVASNQHSTLSTSATRSSSTTRSTTAPTSTQGSIFTGHASPRSGLSSALTSFSLLVLMVVAMLL